MFWFRCRQSAHQTILGTVLIAAVSQGIVAEAQARTVVQKMPSGVRASAHYAVGDPKLPAVLVLHGFLQTRNYITVSGLTAELEGLGYTVLAPTLSLGIDLRKKSLACDAVHSHTLEEDVAEIAHWVDWLAARAHEGIVLIGHSSGSLSLLVYAAGKPNPAVRQFIATSLVDLEQKGIRRQQVDLAQKRLAAGKVGLYPFKLLFCDRYPAPPRAFLSYGEWGSDKILASLRKLKIPMEIIVGGNDKRMDASWPKRLKKYGIPTHVIAGANHFFSDEKEFDLYQEVDSLLTRKEKP